MIRLFEIIISTVGIIVFSPIAFFVLILCLFDTGRPLFLQQRMGLREEPFVLIKFRTMRLGTKSMGSHEVGSSAITPLGFFLRRTKLDELPQLINVLNGSMSFVGPRPNLYSQDEVIRERRALRIYEFKPGITGISQLSGIDMASPKQLAVLDRKMLDELNISLYLRLIMRTVRGEGSGDAAAN